MFEFFDIKTSLIVIGALVAIAAYRFFFQRKSKEEIELEKEYIEILTLDKYKTKGQW